jgi:hypothetical protein
MARRRAKQVEVDPQLCSHSFVLGADLVLMGRLPRNHPYVIANLHLFLGTRRKSTSRPDNKGVRAAILEEDEECQNPQCAWRERGGMPELHVAHITPWREAYAWSLDAHEPGNLIALCPTCHADLDSGRLLRRTVRGWNARCSRWRSDLTMHRTVVSSVDEDDDACYRFVFAHGKGTSASRLVGLAARAADVGAAMKAAKTLRYAYRLTEADKVLSTLLGMCRGTELRAFVLHERAQALGMAWRFSPADLERARSHYRIVGDLLGPDHPRAVLARHAARDVLADAEADVHTALSMNAPSFADDGEFLQKQQLPMLRRRYADILMVRAEYDAFCGSPEQAIGKVKEMFCLADQGWTSDADTFLPRAYAAMAQARKSLYLQGHGDCHLMLSLAAYSAAVSMFYSQRVTGGLARVVIGYVEALDLAGAQELARGVALTGGVAQDHYWNHPSDIATLVRCSTAD